MIPGFLHGLVRLTDKEIDRIVRRVSELILEELLKGMQARNREKGVSDEGGG